MNFAILPVAIHFPWALANGVDVIILLDLLSSMIKGTALCPDQWSLIVLVYMRPKNVDTLSLHQVTE